MQPIDIRIERRITASLATVWRCLTTPETIAEWFFAVDFRPTVGHRFRIEGDATPGWRGWTEVEVLEVEPQRRMVWSFDCTAEATPSRVSFELTERDGSVHLVLVHDGFVPALTRRLLAEGWARYTGALAARAETERPPHKIA